MKLVTCNLFTRFVIIFITSFRIVISQAAESVNTNASTGDESTLRAEVTRSRIKEIETNNDLEETTKTKLLDSYRNVILQLESKAKFDGLTIEYSQAITNAPVSVKTFRQRFQDGDVGTEISSFSNVSTSISSEELNNLISQSRSLLAERKGHLAQLEKVLSESLERPNAIRNEIAQINVILDTFANEILEAPQTLDVSEAERAGRLLLEAQKESKEAEKRSLEQEALSHSARQDLYTAERDYVAMQVARLEDAIQNLETNLSNRRQEEASAALEDAERLRAESVGKHPLIVTAAEKTAQISLEIGPLLPEIDLARERRKQLENLLKRTRAVHVEARKSIDLGVSESVGTILFEERRQLPTAQDFRFASNERQNRTAELRLRLFKIGRETQAMADVSGLASELMASDSAPASVRVELEETLRSQRDNLDQLAGVIRNFLSELGAEEAVERELIAEAEAFSALLDSNLLWILSAAPMDLSTLRRLPSDTGLLLRPASWKESLETLHSDFFYNMTLYLLATGFVGWLLWNRKRWGERFDSLASPIGHVGNDRFVHSIKALLIHIGRSLAISAPGLFLGWRLVVADQNMVFSRAIGYGLFHSFLLLLIGQFIRGIFRPAGLATAHFQWKETTGKIVRRNLAWFICLAMLPVFVTSVALNTKDALVRHSVGRSSFILLMLTTALLGYFLFQSRTGLTANWSKLRPTDWKRYARPPLLLIAVGLPGLLAVLAWKGYFYTSLQLLLRLNLTIILGLLIVFVHAFFVRWLLVSERRLALKMALEKRAARKEEHENEDDELRAETLREISESIDVNTIGEQSRELLRISLGLCLLVGLFLVWIGVLPALEGFGSHRVWDTKAIINGQEKIVSVTIAHLSLALVIFGATVAAARNLPGFLEIAILQRLPMDPGTRYAVRTLVLYCIVGGGLLYTCGAIGISWSSVQWLVAALTVGLGFGLQEIFANFVSGIIILLERPIRVGDTVTVGNVSGVVSRIRMRATTITDWTRKELVVPNKSFITGDLINWSLSDPILRLEFSVGIAYGSDTMLAHRVMLETAKAHPLVLEQPEPSVLFTGFGESSLNFEIRVFVAETSNSGRSRIVHDLHMAIDQACRREKIEIAFPQRDLHLRSAPAVIRFENVSPEKDSIPPSK